MSSIGHLITGNPKFAAKGKNLTSKASLATEVWRKWVMMAAQWRLSIGPGMGNSRQVRAHIVWWTTAPTGSGAIWSLNQMDDRYLICDTQSELQLIATPKANGNMVQLAGKRQLFVWCLRLTSSALIRRTNIYGRGSTETKWKQTHFSQVHFLKRWKFYRIDSLCVTPSLTPLSHV